MSQPTDVSFFRVIIWKQLNFFQVNKKRFEKRKEERKKITFKDFPIGWILNEKKLVVICIESFAWKAFSFRLGKLFPDMKKKFYDSVEDYFSCNYFYASTISLISIFYNFSSFSIELLRNFFEWRKKKKICASPIEANFRWLFESFFIAKNTTWELSIINERTWEAQHKRLVLLVKSKASTLCLSANIIFFHGSLHLCPCLQFSLVCVRGNFCLLSLFLCPLRSPGKRLNWRKI